MGRLYQNSMSAADTDKISISMWARLDEVSAGALVSDEFGDPIFRQFPLIEFGQFDEDNSYAASGVYLTGYGGDVSAFVPGAQLGLDFRVAGRANSVAIPSCLSGNWDINKFSPWTSAFSYDYDNNFPGSGDPQTRDVPAGVGQGGSGGAVWTPYTDLSLTNPVIQFGRWMWIYVAFDTSIASAPNPLGGQPISGPNGHCMVNAVDMGPFTGGDLAATLVPSQSAALSINPAFSTISPAVVFANGHSGIANTGPTYIDTGDGTPTPNAGVSPNPTPGGIVTLTVPAFNIALGGKKIGLPGGLFYLNSKTRLANVQVWAGQFIDPVANYANFVTDLGGGHGKPADPSVAVAAFGTPTFQFSGRKKRDFIVNRGTGGSFSTVGTINDVSEPSF